MREGIAEEGMERITRDQNLVGKLSLWVSFNSRVNIYMCVCVRIEGNVLGFLDIWDFLSLSHLTPHELQRASYV